MRRTYGPILTTGVALTAAAVVVANPIAVAPRSDVRIPSVSLSAGTDDAIGMLDPKFLDAIAPGPPQSGNPFSVLKQLITSLAADATSFGKSAIVDAFVAGIAAVSEPELTASTDSFVSPLIGTIDLTTPEVAMSVLPGIDISSIVPETAALPDVADLTAAVTGSAVPAVRSFVSTLFNDAGYVGGQVVAAAFAAGAVVAAEPGLIGATLVALVKGDFKGALQNAVKAVTAPFGPPAMIVNAITTIVGNHIDGLLSGLAPASSRDAGPAEDVAEPAVPGNAETPDSVGSGDPEARAPRGTAPILPVVDGSDTPAPSAAVALDARSEALTAAAETAAATTPPATRGVRDAVAAAGDQIGEAATATADAVGKIASRTRGGKPGPGAADS